MELKKYIIGIRTIKLKTKIAIKDLGYVGLSNGILLSQHNEVVTLEIIPEKVEMINAKKSPIEDKGTLYYATGTGSAQNSSGITNS